MPLLLRGSDMAPPRRKPLEPPPRGGAGGVRAVPLRPGGSGGADQARPLAEAERRARPHALDPRPLPARAVLAPQAAAPHPGGGAAPRGQVHRAHALRAAPAGLRPVREVPGAGAPYGLDTDAGRRVRPRHRAPGPASQRKALHAEEGQGGRP